MTVAMRLLKHLEINRCLHFTLSDFVSIFLAGLPLFVACLSGSLSKIKM
jgi:hypothetical protein